MLVYSRTTRAFVSCVAVLVALLCGGCEGILAKYVVAAPNRGKSLGKLEAGSPLALPGTVIDHAFRLEIAGDSASDGADEADDEVSLSVWVIDPSNEELVDCEAKPLPLFKSSDGQPRRPLPPRGTVLLVHGFYDEVNQVRYLMWARILAAAGYRAVLVDSRGHGRSTGNFATYGVKESRDLTLVLDELARQDLFRGPLGVMAVSIGASAAVRLAEHDERVEAMVLISAFTSMRDVVPDFGRAIGFDGFSDVKYQRIIDKAGKVGGFDPDEADLVSRIGRINVPVMLIHGEEDKLIPPLHAMRLYAAAGREDVELIRVKGADHTALGGAVAEPIRGPMLGWFERYLTHPH